MSSRERSTRHWWRALLLGGGMLTILSFGRVARAQSEDVTTLAVRDASLYWETPEAQGLYVDLAFRDVVDEALQRKLRRGLPTTIVMTAAVYAEGQASPIATTAQTCRITWHVWEEAYRLEVQRPGETRGPAWTTTVEGVLRRCAEARHLLTGSRGQLAGRGRLWMRTRVLVNPVDEEVLQKIRRWISRPASNGIVGPGDALFSTFTGLFLQRIGTAEREFTFDTRPTKPQLVPGPH